MGLRTVLLGRGATYLFRGLREGDVRVFALGAALLLLKLARRTKPAELPTLRLRPGQSVALRVIRGDEDPVEYRIDA